MKNIYANTEMGMDYPSYISVNHEEDGSISITCRSPGNAGRNSGTKRMTLEEFRQFALSCVKAAFPTGVLT